MISYLFLFGRTPELSFWELQTLFPQVVRLAPDIAQATPSELASLKPETLLSLLGGTVKIATLETETLKLNPLELAAVLTKHAAKKKVIFGLSYYGASGEINRELPIQIKKQLRAQGFLSRFVEPHSGVALTSVVAGQEQVIDLILVRQANLWLIGRTVAVQPYADWNRRDRGRPFADPKAGMLPIKVARMAVNLARPRPFSTADGSDMTLLDPFCGMGTILAEALLTGWQVVGSDQSDVAVRKAQKNLEWLVSLYRDIEKRKRQFLVSEATHISERLQPESVEAIVTEPFMGSTRAAEPVYQKTLSPEKIQNITRGLEKLYLGCLKDWYRVLKPAGKVVIALPKYCLGGRTYFVKRVIDTCENLGYTTLAGPIEYSRPQAVVKREFYVLQKQ
ncbi:MAG: TRM11 family SAM-dependent methyltransferase [Patescibacteria group bacterium]